MSDIRGLFLPDIDLCRREAVGFLDEATMGKSPRSGGASLAKSLSAIESLPPRVGAEPLRTLHHFAATGGTLFTKLVAALPNVLALSELHPHSFVDPARTAFRPSDIAYHLRASGLSSGCEVAERAFVASLLAARNGLAQRGTHLVVRDHTHSDFCQLVSGEESTLLRLFSASGLPVLPIVTVRHPADSFASMLQKGWVSPKIDFVEYCKRYHQFLDAVNATLIVRYEDMVDAPYEWLKKICDAWRLKFVRESVDLFSIYQFSGDSGRSRNVLTKHPPRPEAADLRRSKSKAYISLTARLGYYSVFF